MLAQHHHGKLLRGGLGYPEAGVKGVLPLQGSSSWLLLRDVEMPPSLEHFCLQDCSAWFPHQQLYIQWGLLEQKKGNKAL